MYVVQSGCIEISTLMDEKCPLKREFVIESLTNVFNYDEDNAREKSLEINDEGAGVVAVLPFEIAEQKGVEVLMSARNHGYPLEVKLESN